MIYQLQETELRDDELDKNTWFTSLSRHSRDIYDGANTVGVQLNCKEKLIRNKGNFI